MGNVAKQVKVSLTDIEMDELDKKRGTLPRSSFLRNVFRQYLAKTSTIDLPLTGNLQGKARGGWE